jgi:hypothetical protein
MQTDNEPPLRPATFTLPYWKVTCVNNAVCRLYFNNTV